MGKKLTKQKGIPDSNGFHQFGIHSRRHLHELWPTRETSHEGILAAGGLYHYSSSAIEFPATECKTKVGPSKGLQLAEDDPLISLPSTGFCGVGGARKTIKILSTRTSGGYPKLLPFQPLSKDNHTSRRHQRPATPHSPFLFQPPVMPTEAATSFVGHLSAHPFLTQKLPAPMHCCFVLGRACVTALFLPVGSCFRHPALLLWLSSAFSPTHASLIETGW